MMMNFAFSAFKFLQKISILSSAVLLSFNTSLGLGLAADPFRNSNPRTIGNQTEAAFRAMFEMGNYKAAKTYLEQAVTTESKEPLTYALKASLAYQDEDWESLKLYASKTLEAAQALGTTDPLRSNLYLAVGQFLEGGYIISTEGTLKGAPKALNKLQDVLKFMSAAEKIDPNDPELNLLKGYMDLLLSVNLPFTSSDAAIQKLEQQAQPRYLAYRGIAIGYRGLDQYEKALTYVDKALAETPNNPEVHYLKAQVLAEQGKKLKESNLNTIPVQLQQANQSFSQALTQPEQLPKQTVAQIFYEQCKNLNRIDNGQRPCDPLRDTIKEVNGLWGPVASQLPKL